MNQVKDILAPIYNFAVSVRLSGKPKGIRAAASTVCGHLIRSMPDPRSPGDTEHRCVVSVGNVSDSRDGEARSITLLRKHFDTVIENVFWTTFEPHFISYTSRMSLDSIFYFPPIATSEERAKFKEWFFNARYDFKIAMVHFYYLAEALTRTTKMTPTSFKWIHGIEEELITLARAMEIQFETKLIIQKIFTSAAPKDVRALKIIPLTVNETRNIEDIRYRMWREIYVQNCVSLLGTQISVNLATYADWALIYDIDEAMFINPHMIEKFRKSSLISVLHKTSESHLDVDVLKGDVDVLLQFSAQNVELSGVALVSLSSQSTLPLRTFSNITVQKIRELMFDWLYGLLVLHFHAGVIHTDLHTGNLQYRPYTTVADIIIDNHVYVHSSGVFGFIIDFSRCIVNPYFERARGLSASSVETIAQEQGRLLEQFYLSLYPNAPHKEIVTKLIASDFVAAFHILSILDAIKLARSLMQFFTVEEHIAIIREIHDKCEKLLVDGLNGDAKNEFPLRKFIVDHFELPLAGSNLQYVLSFNKVLPAFGVEISQSNISLLDMILHS